MLKPRRFSAPRGNARESILSLDSVHELVVVAKLLPEVRF